MPHWLLARSQLRTLRPLQRRIPVNALRLVSTASKDKQDPAKAARDTDKLDALLSSIGVEQLAADQPRVVENAPVYSKDEADAIKPSSNEEPGESQRSGARSKMVKQRDPVVVHDAIYPIQHNKWYRLDPAEIQLTQIGSSHVCRVPRLAHGLERVLFSPGVHLLQDPNSRVYNFDPYIRGITQPDEFDFDKLTPYITSSKDLTLTEYARSRKKRFVGSTSSMTHILSHLYFAISGGKQPDISSLSMAFADQPARFTRGMRYPASIALRYRDGVYSIDADKSFDVKDSILSVLGKSLEKLLTSTPSEFEMYKKQNSWKVKEIPDENYHYVEAGEFVMRSQLDCRDDRLPRKTFDLKTRGSLAVRMDIQNHEVSKGYQIKTMKGRLQSFEREYYDMARSAFLKYNFQTRIGNMDGIFVAYHNTARMFGFQYISRREMDEVIFGNERTGNHAFKMILLLLGNLLRTVTDQYPKKDLRVTFDSFAPQQPQMWVEVIDDEKEAIALQQYQETGQFSTAATAATSTPAANVSDADPFAGSDPLDSKATENDLSEDMSDMDVDPADDIYVNTEHPILHYTMDVFSTLNGQDTGEPVTLHDKSDTWTINWKLNKSTWQPDVAAERYKQLRLRQSTYFERAAPDTPDEELSPMVKILRRISRRDLWRNKPPKERIVVNRSRLPRGKAMARYRADLPSKRIVSPATIKILKKQQSEATPSQPPSHPQDPASKP
ncbi:hypothetical protein IWW54_001977 [Coemansia sp. RSA 2705]|nr:hypothetical protein IWW54_001977 [Coemansia sp. RSA 2705]